MGATAEDIETCLSGLAEDVEFGADRCSDVALGKLAEIVADVLAAGDVLVMRGAAARISAFLRLVAGVTVPAGLGPAVKDADAGPESAAAGAAESSATTGLADPGERSSGRSEAIQDEPAPPPPTRWGEHVAGPLLLLIRQLRHSALVQEARERAQENRARSLTIDDRVIDELRRLGPQRSGDLARRLDIDPAQVSRSLTRLVRSTKAREASARSEDGRGRWYEVAQPTEDQDVDVDSDA